MAAVVDMTTTLAFEPKVVHIKAGQTVEWRNNSLFTHSVTADPKDADDPGDVSLPAGAQPFSATVESGQTFTHTFTVPGTYRYICMPHEDLGMVGEVVVEPAT